MQSCACSQRSVCCYDGSGQWQVVPLSFASTPVSKDHQALVPVGGETSSLGLRPLSFKNLGLEKKVVALLLSKLLFTMMITSWDMEAGLARLQCLSPICRRCLGVS